MPGEGDAEHIVDLALIPVRAGEDAGNARHGLALGDRDAHSEQVGVFVGEEVVNQIKARLTALPVVHRGDILGHLKAEFIAQRGHSLQQVL